MILRGILCVLAGAFAATACSYFDECVNVVRHVQVGTYVLDRSAPKNEIGVDEDYTLAISDTEVIETFKRGGKSYRRVYAVKDRNRAELTASPTD